MFFYPEGQSLYYSNLTEQKHLLGIPFHMLPGSGLIDSTSAGENLRCSLTPLVQLLPATAAVASKK